MFGFIIKSGLLAIVLFIVLFTADFVITEGLKKNTSNVYIDWNKIYNGEIGANLIITGSSIAEVQVSPKILDSILNVNSYNLGISGYSFLMQKARYDVFLKHNNQPDVIVQIVGDGLFTKKEGLFLVEQFLPYLDDPVITNITRKYDGLNFIDYKIPFFKYSGKFKTILKGVTSYCNMEILTSNKYKGYTGNDFEWDYRFDAFKKENPKGIQMVISDSILNLFELFIHTETQKGTKIVIVFPPTLAELERYMLNRNEIINLFKSVSEKYNITFLDYSDSDFTMRKELFYNSNHLNKKGSELFSRRLALDLKAHTTPGILSQKTETRNPLLNTKARGHKERCK